MDNTLRALPETALAALLRELEAEDAQLAANEQEQRRALRRTRRARHENRGKRQLLNRLRAQMVPLPTNGSAPRADASGAPSLGSGTDAAHAPPAPRFDASTPMLPAASETDATTQEEEDDAAAEGGGLLTPTRAIVQVLRETPGLTREEVHERTEPLYTTTSPDKRVLIFNILARLARKYKKVEKRGERHYLADWYLRELEAEEQGARNAEAPSLLG